MMERAVKIRLAHEIQEETTIGLSALTIVEQQMSLTAPNRHLVMEARLAALRTAARCAAVLKHAGDLGQIDANCSLTELLDLVEEKKAA